MRQGTKSILTASAGALCLLLWWTMALPQTQPTTKPPTPPATTQATRSMTAGDLAEMIRDVAFARSASVTRFAIERVLVSVRPGLVSAVATDGWRLAQSSRPVNMTPAPPEPEFEVLLPRELNDVLLALRTTDQPLRLTLTDTACAFDVAGHSIALERVRSSDSKVYPDYAKVIPTTARTSAMIATADLQAALQQFRRDQVTPRPTLVISAVPGAALSLAPGTSKDVRYTVPAKTTGQPVSLVCNADFLWNFSEIMRKRDCTMELNSPSSAITFRADNRIYVIMPIQGP